ncbi:MAG: hypothetical protein R3D85_04360 [Paracoccaceae bacterium]
MSRFPAVFQMLALALSLGVLPALAPPARADDMTPLLVLQRLVDGKVTGEVVLSGNAIDPNTVSVSDRYRITVDGRAVRLPDEALATLAHARRAFAYDSQSGGIETPNRQALCAMAGPAIGDLLSVRYLDYKDHRIVGDQMRPVLGRAGNCLFTTLPHPKTRPAETEAARLMGALQMLLAQKGR